ncbi:MAG: DnaD domain protein [Bacilli bacterium]|nr:DnaD domain protein [Bacilli bacterium]MDD4733842.1 DnaD domain protein [Bacilli bacterium]
MNSIVPIDRFVVVNKSILTDNDRKNLLMLYQPIIGFTSVNLYFTLWTYLEKSEIISEEFDHYSILENMKISLIEFVEAKEKLEALGLIKTYFKNGEINNYLYELYSPFEPNQFFKNPILNTLLYSNVDKKRYKKIVDYFKIPALNLEDYKNITCKLSDVFEVGIINNEEYPNIKKITRGTITIEPNIDLNIVFSLIPSELLNKRKINHETKNFIVNLSLIYGFDNEEIKNLIENSITEMKIDLNKLELNAQEFYKFENDGHLPNLIYKNQPEYLRKKNTTVSSRDKMIYQYETSTPYEYLKLKYNGGKISSYDTETLKILVNQIKINPGVVNVLVDYVLKINNNKLTRNFIETIAGQWKRDNIQTVEEAMNIAEKEYKSKKQITRKKEFSKPEWVGKEYEKDTNPDKIKRMEEILKEYR